MPRLQLLDISSNIYVYMVSLQALTSTSPPNPPLRFSTWDCFASIQSYPHTLVYIIVPLQESSKSASASLVKRPQHHSSLQDQVDWSLPIKWTPRSTGPSTHIRNLALPLSREASATLALPPLSPTTSVSRGRLTPAASLLTEAADPSFPILSLINTFACF